MVLARTIVDIQFDVKFIDFQKKLELKIEVWLSEKKAEFMKVFNEEYLKAPK